PETYKQYWEQPKEEVYSWDVNNTNDVTHVINQLLIEVASSKDAHYIESVSNSASMYEDKLNSALEQINEIFGNSSQKPIDDKAETGGIDLSPAKIDLTIQDNSEAIKFNLDTAMLQLMQNASGVTPVIIGINSLDSLSAFMGVHEHVIK
ncbi:MAG: hypothetical protein V2A70_04940, partial [Candidatus Omnitrophota bacterium]